MQPFRYHRARHPDEAIAIVAGDPKARFLAGGTNLVDLMRQQVETPSQIVDIRGLSYDTITELPDGGVRLGALTSNSVVARSELVRTRYPVLSEALLLGASTQLRNMASIGGNLVQRNRCSYFIDGAFACNKRAPGSGCAALRGFSRGHAILGASEHCIATHPSDLALALVVLDAVVRTRGPRGERAIPIDRFHPVPSPDPQRETVLDHGELITAVDIPARSFATNSTYRKVRDRQSYAFALVSVAAALRVESGIVREARIALGGVATKPWHPTEAETALIGKPAERESFETVARLATFGARTTTHNAFKEKLVQRTLVRTLERLAS